VLSGQTLRVPDQPAPDVARALAGLPARVSEQPATLEERFFALATAATAGTAGTGGTAGTAG